MIRKLIFSICMICPVLSGCTDDDMMPSSQASISSQTVPVRLNFSTAAFNTPLQGDTRAGGESTVLSVSNRDMDIELVKTPVTRAAGAAVDKETAVYHYTILQFDGTTDNSILKAKAIYDCPGGVIDTKSVEFQATTGPDGAAVKHRFVVIANDNKISNSLTVNTSTYSDLQNMSLSQAGNNIFPLHKVTIPEGGQKEAMIMCGLVDATLSAGDIGGAKQLFITLQRTVAKVTFNIKRSDGEVLKDFDKWSAVLMSIPNKSYFNIVGRSAVFPAVDSQSGSPTYWAKPLTSVEENLPLTGKFAYLPVNLQESVALSTLSSRRNHAPTGGTYIQIMGKELVAVGSVSGIKDFVLYQIYLGSNLTTDFSVYPNYNLTYNITLKGNSDKDSNVVRFIPGYFSGGLKAYNLSGTALTSMNDQVAVKWQYSKRLEAFFQDSQCTSNPADNNFENTDNGLFKVRWHIIGTDNRGATSLTNGHENTGKISAPATSGTEYLYKNFPAVQACYEELNGYNVPGVLKASSWYLPSVSELIGTWISSASMANQLSDSYWSSTALGNDRAFFLTTKGEVKTAPVNSGEDRHYVRGFRDPDAPKANQ